MSLTMHALRHMFFCSFHKTCYHTLGAISMGDTAMNNTDRAARVEPVGQQKREMKQMTTQSLVIGCILSLYLTVVWDLLGRKYPACEKDIVDPGGIQ